MMVVVVVVACGPSQGGAALFRFESHDTAPLTEPSASAAASGGAASGAARSVVVEENKAVHLCTVSGHRLPAVGRAPPSAAGGRVGAVLLRGAPPPERGGASPLFKDPIAKGGEGAGVGASAARLAGVSPEDAVGLFTVSASFARDVGRMA